MLQAAHKGETERKKSETKLHNHNYACFFFFLLLFVCLLLLRAKNDGSIEEVRSFIGKKKL